MSTSESAKHDLERQVSCILPSMIGEQDAVEQLEVENSLVLDHIVFQEFDPWADYDIDGNLVMNHAVQVGGQDDDVSRNVSSMMVEHHLSQQSEQQDVRPCKSEMQVVEHLASCGFALSSLFLIT